MNELSIIYFCPSEDGRIPVVAVIDGKPTKILWSRREAMNRCAELLQYIAEAEK